MPSGHNVCVWLLEASTHWPLCVKRLLERSKFISMGCRIHEGTLSIIFSFPFLHGSLLLFSAFIFPSGMWTFFLYLSLLSFSRSSQLPISFFHQIISHARHTHTHTHTFSSQHWKNVRHFLYLLSLSVYLPSFSSTVPKVFHLTSCLLPLSPPLFFQFLSLN